MLGLTLLTGCGFLPLQEIDFSRKPCSQNLIPVDKEKLKKSIEAADYINTQEWKRYSNRKLGVKFLYPSDWEVFMDSRGTLVVKDDIPWGSESDPSKFGWSRIALSENKGVAKGTDGFVLVEDKVRIDDIFANREIWLGPSDDCLIEIANIDQEQKDLLEIAALSRVSSSDFLIGERVSDILFEGSKEKFVIFNKFLETVEFID